MNNPLVSIVIPTCDRPTLLRRAIRSALRQSYREIEVLVIDDGNTDAGQEVAAEFHDTRLRSYRNRNRKGACGSRNTGIELAGGQFYAGLDDDDYFHEDRINVLLKAFRPEFSFVASNAVMLRHGSSEPRFRGERLIQLTDLLWGGNCVGNQVLTETVRARSVGGFDESLASGQDTDMWIRLIEKWGPALRIAPCLYTIDCSHGAPRITTTVGMSYNMASYLDRHSAKMGRAQRLVTMARMAKYGDKPHRLLRIASLCFPASWNYYYKRLARIW